MRQGDVNPLEADSATPRSALWNLGFRPFYLAASLFAALSVAVWTAQYAGALPAGYLGGILQHGHEMLFGYVLAVVAGFLLTAVRNWTGQPTPTGAILAALVALWLAGRIMVLTPFPVASALVNAAFPLAVAAAIGVPLAASRNQTLDFRSDGSFSCGALIWHRGRHRGGKGQGSETRSRRRFDISACGLRCERSASEKEEYGQYGDEAKRAPEKFGSH